MLVYFTKGPLMPFFLFSTPVPRPRCEAKCRDYGSSPQNDRPRSNGLTRTRQADKLNGRTSSAGKCAKQTNTLIIPQAKQTDQANRWRHDHKRALRPSMHLHLLAQYMLANTCVLRSTYSLEDLALLSKSLVIHFTR